MKCPSVPSWSCASGVEPNGRKGGGMHATCFCRGHAPAWSEPRPPQAADPTGTTQAWAAVPAGTTPGRGAVPAGIRKRATWSLKSWPHKKKTALYWALACQSQIDLSSETQGGKGNKYRKQFLSASPPALCPPPLL